MNEVNIVNSQVRQLGEVILDVTSKLEAQLQAQYQRNPAQFRCPPTIRSAAAADEAADPPPWRGEFDNYDRSD